jgi:hypothetical protein
MKKIILLALFMPVMAYGQVFEDFENGNPGEWIQSTEGHWKPDTVSSISGIYSLHHVFDNTSSGSDCIGFPLTDLHPDEGATEWKFLIRHGCDPSSSNNWAVYLMSDKDPVSFARETHARGFAVGVNLTGYDDTLRLWKINNGTVSVITTCPLNWQYDIGTAKAAEVIAERSESGLWSISVYNTDNKLISAGKGFDDELFNPYWFVLNYKYTSTRDRLLWLDEVEINGVFYSDTVPPHVKECILTGRRSVEIYFDEEPSGDCLVSSNFLSGDALNEITGISRKTGTSCIAEFTGEFRNKTENSLTISRLCDVRGNCSDNVKVKFTPVWVEAGDVIISEIMADPLPEVGLPGEEYIEITNRSTFSFDLAGWVYTAGDQKAILPAIVIDPGDYLVLCSVADTALFNKNGRTVGLKPFPALNDDGKILVLSDSLGNLIHGLEYSSGWYRNKLKAGGGWSLEIIDINSPFYTEGNWEASSSPKGGTPGKINSASRTNRDPVFCGIENVFPEDSISINLKLSETVFGLNESYEGITIGNDYPDSVVSADLLLRKFIINTSVALEPEQVYILHLSGGIADFEGNLPARSSYLFGIPMKAGSGDIIFNELLFNPFPGEPDYIELYNRSEKTIDASRLYLASISENGDTSKLCLVSDEPRCFIPGDFFVVTADPVATVTRYFTSDEDKIFSVSSLPSMPDTRGHLLLLNRELEIIDEVIYSDDMHNSLLSASEGVSLEKIRPQIESFNSLNWHSASESSGWGTPGRENSVYCKVPQTDDMIIFSSGRISPDNDGYEDFLVIDINPEGIGNVVTVTVFDETGGYIRRITENLFAGSRASVVWDGTSADGNIVRTGIYIILIELFNDKGKTKSWKKVCTVIR